MDVQNPYNPDQYNVYIGAFDLSFLKTPDPSPDFPTVLMSVKQVIRVSFLKFISELQFKKIYYIKSIQNLMKKIF